MKRERGPCTRFSRSGVPCDHWTDNLDAWCRQEGCEGFVRPVPVGRVFEPSTRVSFAASGSQIDAERIRATRVWSDERRRISLTAIDLYKAHHGGSTVDAEGSLTMLAEWCVTAAKDLDVTRNGPYTNYASDGYGLTIAEDGTVVSYAAIHRDRTWAQTKAGISSRVSGGKKRTARFWFGAEPYTTDLHRAALAELAPDETRTGEILNVVKFGAFVRVGVVVGLLHESAFGPEVATALAGLQKGAEIEVVVGEIDLDRLRLQLLPSADPVAAD